MKIAIAQLRSIRGDIEKNIKKHQDLIADAVKEEVNIIIFPELSITGYEPALAKHLAITKENLSLEVFQQISDLHNITIGVGMPIKEAADIYIGMVLFQANKKKQFYFKEFLHEDEVPYFSSGKNTFTTISTERDIAIAICYELFVPEHYTRAAKDGASIYLTSVAKSAKGVERAYTHLPSIAKQYAMTIFMANCIGPSDDFIGAGLSAVWNKEGQLIKQLGRDVEGLLVLDV